jgi:beta-lactamase regulating signal transducer with metallopeptidase domain
MNALSWTDSWFVQLAGQTFICLALGLWVAARLERRPARAYTVVLLSILAALSAPIASRFVSAVNGGVFVGTASATEFSLPDEPSRTAATSAKMLIGDLPFALWGVGTLPLLLGIAVSYIRGRRLVARAEPVSDPRLLDALAAAQNAIGLRAMPELRSHPEVPSPMVWAWSRTPVALIPDEATAQIDGVDWESIFIHELAHIARRDHVTGLFADVAAAVLFWNPAIWWARRQLARQSEFACDDRVAVVGRSPVEFASALLALRREALIPQIPATNLCGSRGWLKARVSRLVQITEQPSNSLGVGWSGSALLVAVTIVIALAFAQSRQGPKPETSFAPPLTLSMRQMPGSAP